MLAAGIVECARDVARLADLALERSPCDEESLAGLLAAVEARVQAALPLLRPRGEPPPACALGCATCCTVNVGTLPIEGAAAAAFLRHRAGPDEIAGQAAALLGFHEGVRWLDDGERIRAFVNVKTVWVK